MSITDEQKKSIQDWTEWFIEKHIDDELVNDFDPLQHGIEITEENADTMIDECYSIVYAKIAEELTHQLNPSKEVQQCQSAVQE